MVLADLGAKITNALRKLNSKQNIDEATLNELLTEIASALLSSDVNIHYINKLRNSVKTQVTLQMGNDMGGANLRKLITKTVVDELTEMLSSKNKAYEFQRGKSNVVMFVGLQGAGKTTTCTKFAFHYMKKGWRVGLVCADTFRAGAFEQLKMNAAKIKCPFFGHKKETDPVKIAEEGVAFFRQQKYEIIIVDTSGRHKQEESLFEEMKQVQATIKPDTGVFVMDGSIGQACFDQAKAFKESVKVGSVIITKLDGHAKGGGSLSAVAATESPIVFLGTGEHFEDLESFEASSFVRRLLGMGDMAGLMKTVTEAMSDKQQRHIIDQIKKGQFTLRDMRDQFSSVLNMGPLSNVVGMIPGFNANMIPKGQEKESTDRIKKFLYMMDSMTKEELDCIKPLTEKRVLRISQGAGTNPKELLFLLSEHKRFSKMVERMGKMNLDGLDDMSQMKRNPKQMMQQLQSALDPSMVKQMGGMGNLMNIVQSMQNGDMGDMGSMMQNMMGQMGGMGGMPGGMPGGGGMPNMGNLAQMMQGMGGAGGGGGMPGGMGGMAQMMQQMMGGGGGGGMRMPPGMPKGMMRMGRR